MPTHRSRAAPLALLVLSPIACACGGGHPSTDASVDAPTDATTTVDAPPPDTAPQDAAAPNGDVPFPSAIFRATHNSYSGDVDGMKGPITTQLDRGVRFTELDIHDDDYAATHDFGIGHDTIGMAVDHDGGNPTTNALRDWLLLVSDWSSRHPTHAPMTVMFDIKTDLTDNGSYAQGDLAALNDEFASAFGAQLFPPGELAGAWPTVDALRGRVMVLLSGDPGTRAAYRRDTGQHPAVAINAHGQLVEVHEGSGGALWYWTGAYADDGRVDWLRHGRLDAGQAPAVALNDDGWVVEVHQGAGASTLWHRAGRLGSDGEIAWGTSAQFDAGAQPSVRFTSPTGLALREIHRSAALDATWSVNGTLDPAASTVAWDATSRATTTDPRFDTASSMEAGGRHVAVFTGADGSSPADTLRYTTGAVTGGRVSYRQLAFVEYQYTDSAELEDGAWYWAAPATQTDFVLRGRAMGRIVRGWDFDSALFATMPLANYPATNTPYASWYTTLLARSGAIE